MTQFTLQRKPVRVQHYIEDLDGVDLDMVLIPEGNFMMGSPDDEPEREPNEGPQHSVAVPSFFMGRYPVTQAQWRAVANTKQFPKVELDLEPSPSNFEGDDLPVEQVNWHEAMEFCQRLSHYTNREYRLPSEAEWEYACRAGTTTPFYFGETLSTEAANYHGPTTYGRGNPGEYRETTTPAGSFPPNPFGLCDMHGNVDEWCLDHWHGSYKEAPTDGSAWLTGGDSQLRILRGGSWYFNPRNCRSAYRSYFNPANRHSLIGFRVMCVLPRTLP